MENMMNVGNFDLLQKMETFNNLFHGFPAGFAKISDLALLNGMFHAAKHPLVPEGTPVPGFERPTLHQMTSQDIASALEYTEGRSFMEDLNEAPETIEELFNGRPHLGFEQSDMDNFPDLSVFDQLQEEHSFHEQYPLALLNLKEEAKSPMSSCDSVYSYSSASPPHSPAISDISSQAYSTDEGIQSDFSDVDELLSPVGSPLSTYNETEKQQIVVKTEPSDVTTTKTQRRKRGPKPPVKYRGDGPIQLWQFLLELLIDPNCGNLIKWTQDEDYEFKILQPTTVAKMWGKKKNKPTMNYEKLSRGLRYYYGKNVIEKVHGKRYVYQFMCDIKGILGYDPMVKCEEDSGAEDVVCGEPVMSPEVEDLLVSSSVGDGFYAGPLDFSALCGY